MQFQHSLDIDNIVALPYLMKMGGHIIVLSELSKEIWDYLIENGVMNTAEYLPRAINKEADFQS